MKERFYEALNEIEQDDNKYLLLYRNGECIAKIDGGREIGVSLYVVDDKQCGYYLGIGCYETIHLYFDNLRVHSI